MRRLLAPLWRAAAGLGVTLCVGVVVFWVTLSPGDPSLYPPLGDDRVRVAVLNHGWHTGLVLPTDELNGAAVRLAATAPEAAERLRWLATRWPEETWVEVGWGDAEFYRTTPTLGDLDPWLAFRAVAWPTPSVLQAVPGSGPLAGAFQHSDMVELELSRAGFDRLAVRLAASVPPEGERMPMGPSLYGWGAFFPALPSYHLFRMCNHWTSSLLRAAGVPSSALPSTFSGGLLEELRWRAGAG